MEELSDLYTRKTGIALYPGTLNLELEQPWSVPPAPLRLESHEYGGRVSVNIVPCQIQGLQGFILRTDQNEREELHHPRTIIEIAASVRLRDEFDLVDGDVIEVRTAGPNV
jgi:riboflavin kinase